MKWHAIGRDADGVRRQIKLDAEDEADAQRQLRAQRWSQVENLVPDLGGQTLRKIPKDTPHPALVEVSQRVVVEPSKWRQVAMMVPAAYRANTKFTAAYCVALGLNLLLGGPALVSGFLGLGLLVPLFAAAIGQRRTGQHTDYRWAIATADWATALDRAEKLSGILEPNLAKCLMARAHAGAGERAEAYRLLEALEVGPKFTRLEMLAHKGLVLTEAQDHEGALQASLDFYDASPDRAAAAQGVAWRYAFDFWDGAAARPYLEEARAIRDRASVVTLIIDTTEVAVQTALGEIEGLAARIDELIPVAEGHGYENPEVHGLDMLLHAYACLAKAKAAPERAAEHFRIASDFLRQHHLEDIEARCSRALGLD